MSKLKKLSIVLTPKELSRLRTEGRHKGTEEKAEFVNSSFFLCVLCELANRRFDASVRLISVVFVFIILLLSCASSPKMTSYADETWLSLLPAGARVYLWADTVKARPLLDVLSFQDVNGKDAAQVLDKTKTAAVAFFSDGKSGDITADRQFFIAAMGNYPQFGASLSFAFSKSWKKQKSSAGGSYWYSQKDNIALVMGAGLALVSNTDPLTSFSAVSAPGGFAEFNRGFALAGWMNDSAEAINGFLASMGIPLQLPAEDLFFGAKNEAELWNLVFKIRTQSAAQARSLLTLFSIARLFVMRAQDAGGDIAGEPMNPQQAAALLFANVPELENEYLILRMDSLEADKIALLFKMFTVYSG